MKAKIGIQAMLGVSNGLTIWTRFPPSFILSLEAGTQTPTIMQVVSEIRERRLRDEGKPGSSRDPLSPKMTWTVVAAGCLAGGWHKWNKWIMWQQWVCLHGTLQRQWIRIRGQSGVGRTGGRQLTPPKYTRNQTKPIPLYTCKKKGLVACDVL